MIQILWMVSSSCISTGTERLLSNGMMPPCPSLGLARARGYATVGAVVRVGGSDDFRVGETGFSHGVRNNFGGAGSRPTDWQP